jgi:hypothetical protein
VRPRPGDQFKRFDECAVMDFLKLIRVGIEIRPEGSRFGTVQLTAPARHRFFLAPPGG